MFDFSVINQVPAIDILKNNIEQIASAPNVSIYWKDKSGKYVGVNEKVVKMSGLDNTSDLIGLNDYDFIWRDYAHLYQKNDQMVIATDKLLTTVEHIRCADNNDVKYCLSHKIPTKLKTGKVTGMIGFSFMLDNIQAILATSVSELVHQQNSLTRREYDLAKLLVRGGTAKKIANTLHLSHRTVENYLANLKSKFNATSKAELIEKLIDFL
jgi:DNA-binding CsgD family transcriptional regulator